MDHPGHRSWLKLWRTRMLAAALLGSAGTLLPAGCTGPSLIHPAAMQTEGKLVRAQQEEIPVPPRPQPTSLPPVKPSAPRMLPIGLDTVLRLVDEQNSQIAIARAKVNEALAEQDLAAQRWLPNVYAGTGYCRHEGGIQNEDGTMITSSSHAMYPSLQVHGELDIREYAFQRINAEREAWQQKGELSRISHETLLDAANTYLDLLTARTGQAIAQEQLTILEDLLKRAEKLASVEKAARVEVIRVRSEVEGQRQVIVKLRQQASAASAKLVYLLGLDPCIELAPVDTRIAPFVLIDASPPACDLVEQSLRSGPGVRELEGLLALIHEGIERASGPMRLMPILEMRMDEGAFGAGPNSSMGWANRWDLGMQMRWNLTEFLTVRERRRSVEARMQQAQLAYQDLRAKLTLGIQEARDAVHSGREQIDHGEKQVANAKEAFDLSLDRLQKTLASRENPLGGSYSETLLALRAVSLAQLNYLTAIRDYDRAQLRLMLLLGSAHSH